jgi:hypothetical protein
MSSILSTASIIAAINSKLVSSISSNTNRFTTKKMMKQLSERGKQQAKSFQMSAFEAVSDVDTSSSGVFGSLSYIFSNALFALSSALINDGIIDNTDGTSEFKYLNANELELEIVESSKKVLLDLSVTEGTSFEVVLDNLKYHRSLTLSTMHEIFQLLEDSSSSRDTVLIYMDVIRDSFNYAITCMESCMEAYEFKYEESQDNHSTTISVDIRIPVHKDIETFTMNKRDILQGDIGEYVRASYGIINQLIDLTGSYVICRLHTEAFTHFITINNKFNLIVNGRLYNMSYRDVLQSCSSFRDLVKISNNRIYGQSLNLNMDSLLDAHCCKLPAYIVRKIEKSRLISSNKVNKVSEERFLSDQFNNSVLRVISSYNKIIYNANSLEGVTSTEEKNIYDIIGGSIDFYKELGSTGTTQQLLAIYKNRINKLYNEDDNPNMYGVASAHRHVKFRLSSIDNDGDTFDTNEYENFDLSTNTRKLELIRQAQRVADVNRYEKLPKLENKRDDMVKSSKNLSDTKDAFSQIIMRMTEDDTIDQTVKHGLVNVIEAVIDSIQNADKNDPLINESANNDISQTHKRITHLLLLNKEYKIDDNFNFYINETGFTTYFKYENSIAVDGGDKIICYNITNYTDVNSIKQLNDKISISNDKIKRLSSLIVELDKSIELTSGTLTYEKGVKADFMLQMNTDLQEVKSVTSDINKLIHEQKYMDTCINNARRKINEIVNIRDQFQIARSGHDTFLNDVKYQQQ